MNEFKSLLLSDDPVSELWRIGRSNDLYDLEPALAALKMSIPDGYHHKNNWDHSVRVLGNAIERETNGPDLILRTTALLHDIGKPKSRRFEGKGVVTFRNHETIGARQSHGLLSAHGYSVAERETISHLISLHMRAYGFGEVLWSDSAVRRLAKDAGGQENMSNLISIFYSDLTTQNMNKKRRVENGIARLEDAIEKVQELDAEAARRPSVNGDDLKSLYGLKEGKELGLIMKFLYSNGLGLSREDAISLIEKNFDLKS